MAVCVLLDRENLHLPAIGLPVPIGVIEEWISCTLPRTRDEEDLASIVKAVTIGVGIVAMGDVKVKPVYNLLPILKAVVVCIKGGGIREIVNQCPVIVPGMAINGLPIVFQSIVIGILVRCVSECLVVLN